MLTIAISTTLLSHLLIFPAIIKLRYGSRDIPLQVEAGAVATAGD